jgi:hypothetical protein
MKYYLSFGVIALLLAVGGCVPSSYTRTANVQAAEQDTVQRPPMTVQDVIDLSKAGVSDNLIIAQMKSTHSYFELNTDDIIALKQAGVDDTVITAMINSQPRSAVPYYRRAYLYGDWYYPYYYGYDPWFYSPFYFDFGYYGHPHFGGFPGIHRGSIGHSDRRFGGHR